MKKYIILFAFIGIAFLQTNVFASVKFYIKIQGATQGTFKGESIVLGRPDWSECLSFHYEVEAPRDAATGLPTGKRMHKPLTIIKEWGAASPQIYTSLVTNENLSKVILEFIKTDALGKEFVYQRITLLNAAIVDDKLYKDMEYNNQPNAAANYFSLPELEQVSFVFQKITIENVAGGTTAGDSWL
jgi:type VI secretion system secreted protein Hcp